MATDTGQLYNPKTGILATPAPGMTADQRTNAMNMGFTLPVAYTPPATSPTTPVGNTQPPTVDTKNPLDASLLGNKALGVPNPVNDTKATDALGALASSTVSSSTTDTKNAPEAAKVAPAGNQGILDYLKGVIGLQSTKGAYTEQLQNDNQLAQKIQTLNQLSSEAMSTEKGYRDQIKRLQQEARGTVGGNQQRIQKLQQQANDDLANIAIRQKAAQGDVNAANDIIKAKVDAKFEPIDNVLKTLQLYQQFYNNDLTDKEKFELQMKVDERKEQKRVLTDAYSKVLSSSFENNAPQSVLKAIDAAAADPNATAASIYAAAGQYGSGAGGAAKTEVVDVGGRKLLINSKTGETIREIGADGGAGGSGELDIAQREGNIDTITNLVNDRNLNSAVGPNPFARASFADPFTGGRTNFIASVNQLTSQLTLDSLQRAKKQGATFGALSDSELKILSDSATKISSWAIKDRSGNVTGYKATETAFKQELDKINNLAKLDYILKGGEPDRVGVKKMDDGTYWTKNSDGSFTQIR